MKKLIALLIVLMFVTTSYAEESTHEETVCIPNKAGGVIHLRKNMTAIGSSSAELNSIFITGQWEMVGNSLVMITWDDKTHTVIPKNAFILCSL